MFEKIHQLEFPLIYWVQGFRTPFLDVFFKLWNLVDTNYFVFILFPAVWLGYQWRSGARVFYLISLSSLVCTTLKKVLAQPRPFNLEPGLNIVSLDSSYGFPSGAAQMSVIYACLIIGTFRSAWAWVAGIAVFFFLSISRVYLGVHFPTDLVGGWVLGGIFVWVYYYLFPPIERALEKMSLWKRFLFSQSIPLLVLAIAYYFKSKSPMIIALSTSGAGVGLSLCAWQKSFLPTSTSFIEALVRTAVGALGIFIIYFSQLPFYIWGFLMGLWLSYLSSLTLKSWIADDGNG